MIKLNKLSDMHEALPHKLEWLQTHRIMGFSFHLPTVSTKPWGRYTLTSPHYTVCGLYYALPKKWSQHSFTSHALL